MILQLWVGNGFTDLDSATGLLLPLQMLIGLLNWENHVIIPNSLTVLFMDQCLSVYSMNLSYNFIKWAVSIVGSYKHLAAFQILKKPGLPITSPEVNAYVICQSIKIYNT